MCPGTQLFMQIPPAAATSDERARSKSLPHDSTFTGFYWPTTNYNEIPHIFLGHFASSSLRPSYGVRCMTRFIVLLSEAQRPAVGCFLFGTESSLARIEKVEDD